MRHADFSHIHGCLLVHRRNTVASLPPECHHDKAAAVLYYAFTCLGIVCTVSLHARAFSNSRITVA